MENVVSLLPLVAIALVFWLFIIRPASRRNKETARMQAGVSVGDTVMMTSGIFGTVIGLTDDRIRIEIADGVTIEAVRGAIGQVIPAGTETEALDSESYETADDAVSLDKPDADQSGDAAETGDQRKDA